VDIDRPEQKDLGRRAGGQSLRDRLSTSDGGDLIFAQSDVLPKECLQVWIRLRNAGKSGRGKQGQQCSSAHNISDHGNFTPGAFRLSLMARPFDFRGAAVSMSRVPARDGKFFNWLTPLAFFTLCLGSIPFEVDHGADAGRHC